MWGLPNKNWGRKWGEFQAIDLHLKNPCWWIDGSFCTRVFLENLKSEAKHWLNLSLIDFMQTWLSKNIVYTDTVSKIKFIFWTWHITLYMKCTFLHWLHILFILKFPFSFGSLQSSTRLIPVGPSSEINFRFVAALPKMGSSGVAASAKFGHGKRASTRIFSKALRSNFWIFEDTFIKKNLTP